MDPTPRRSSKLPYETSSPTANPRSTVQFLSDTLLVRYGTKSHSSNTSSLNHKSSVFENCLERITQVSMLTMTAQLTSQTFGLCFKTTWLAATTLQKLQTSSLSMFTNGAEGRLSRDPATTSLSPMQADYRSPSSSLKQAATSRNLDLSTIKPLSLAQTWRTHGLGPLSMNGLKKLTITV